MAPRLWLPFVAAVTLLASGSAGASSGAVDGPVSHAVAIRVSVPGQAGAAAASVAAPRDAVASGGAFAYPADGSVVRAASATAGAFAVLGKSPSASASSEVSSLSLFNGEITAATVTARVKAKASPTAASGDSSGSQVVGLTVLGRGVSAAPGARFELGDWGYALTLGQAASPAVEPGVRGFVISEYALLVRLTAEHGGLPAGSEILVGYADASARAAKAAPPPPPPKPKPKQDKPRRAPPDDRARPPKAEQEEKSEPVAPLILPTPHGLNVRLTTGGYVFPVYGPASFSDTFGAGRAVVGWHHGEDIFAPLGAPLLAVADGTVFSVGWNDLGGLRLWLRDRRGNEFYYAHLSAFSQLAVNGNQVEAGDVLGFVGNTGDAEHTPYHLHFEIHPVSLLHKGYDGVIAPYPILVAWQRVSDVVITGVAGWAAPIPPGAKAPKPGAILLQVADISTANGLDPGSLRRAMRAASLDADGSIAGLRAVQTRLIAALRRLTGR